MEIVNFFHADIKWNGLEICVELLQKILVSKISGKAIEKCHRKDF